MLKITSSLLDIGGGSGVFAMAFKNKKNELKATVFDLPNVIPLTKESIEKEGFDGKIKAWFDKANIRFISNEQTQFETGQIIGQK